jgi:DNA polymerase-3 subunit alpha
MEAPFANEIFDTMEKFAGYGFNKSHAAAYALIGYQTGLPESATSRWSSSPPR